MKETFSNRIKKELNESQIDWKVIIAFIPIAFITFLFTSLGIGHLENFSGNDMMLSLNNSSPKNGRHFIEESDALWSAIGGPVFTILQALIFLLLTWLTKSIYAYSITFFAVFSRFFPIIFGGFNLQDEARIAAMLDWNKYIVALIVLTILFLILWRSTRIMKLNKAIGYFTVLGVFAILIVIGVNEIITTK